MTPIKSIHGINYIIPPQITQADIIPGVYEGGLTLWECTADLLSLDKNFQDKIVVDMGCGLGLLGIQALKQGAKKVIFQDFNKETFDQAVKQQLELNELKSAQMQFIYGDWEQIKLDEEADLILGSELIYREENYSKIITFVRNSLKKPSGEFIMINKNYYFGVGGSIQGFKEYVQQDKSLIITEQIEIKNLKGNKKTILYMRKS